MQAKTQTSQVGQPKDAVDLDDDFLMWSYKVYSGGLDNDISVWELRKGAAAMKLKGHTHSITGKRH
eukprot:gene11889-12033_t